MHSILVICVGNICRSPIAERMLRRDVAGLTVNSAGLSAAVGREIQPEMAALAAKIGIDAGGHCARQFTIAMGTAHDLILVMERRHRDEITRMAPELHGRCLLFDHWSGGAGIDDPYRRGQTAYDFAFNKITSAAQSWAARLIS